MLRKLREWGFPKEIRIAAAFVLLNVMKRLLNPRFKVSASLRSAQDRGPPDLVRPIFRIKLKWWEAFKTSSSRYFFNKFVSNYFYQSKAEFTSFRIDKDMTLACRHIDF